MLNLSLKIDNTTKKRPHDYIFVKDPRRIRKHINDAPNFKNDTSYSNSENKSRTSFDEMHVIKESIGNIIYEKWFLENFSK